MALKVGELYATMRLENKDFDRALDQSGAKFTSLGAAIGKGTQAAAKVFAATTTAAVGLGAAALKVGLDYNRMQQTSRAALLTILGSAEAVNAQMAELDAFASKSPFAKQVFLQAQQQMLGFGIEASKVIPYLDAIQNSVAAVGGSNNDIAEIVDIFSKIAGASKITSQNLNELGHRGLDAAAIIGKAMGKTAQEIRAEITAGTLDAGAALDALAAGMTAQFGGATDNIKQQMDGAADRVKAAWRDIGSVMATPLIDPTSGGQLVEWTNLFADGLRAVQGQAAVLVPLLWDRLTPGVDAATGALQKATVVISGWNTRNFERSLDKISSYTPLIASTSAALFALGTTNLPILRTFGITGINPVVAGVAALVAFSPELRQVGREFLEALQPGIAPAKELATIIGDFLMAALAALTPALSSLLTSGANVAVMFLNMLVPAVQATTNIILPLIEAGADLIEWLAKLPTPVLGAVAAFASMKALGIDKVLSTLPGVVGSVVKSFGNLVDSANTAGNLGIETLSGKVSEAAAGLNTAKAAASGFASTLTGALVANAPLIAISALVGILGYFAAQAAEAKARADNFRDAMKGMAVGSDDARKAAAELAQEMAVTGEVTWGWLEKFGPLGVDTFTDALKMAGSSAKELGEAVAGTDAAFDAYVERIKEAASAAGMSGPARDGMLREINKLRDGVVDGESQLAQLTNTTQSAEQAQSAYNDTLKAAADAVDRLRSAEASLAAAKGDLRMAQYAASDALDAWIAKVVEAGGVQRDSNGTLIQSGDAWRAYEEGAIRSRDAIIQVAENMVKAGASQAEIDDYIQSATGSWIAQADAMGVNSDEAAAYLDTIGGIPPFVSTQVELGTEPATEELDKLLNEIQNSHGSMVIDASSSPAHAELLRALGLVEVAEGQFAIDANADPATAALMMTLGTVDTSTGILTMDANNEPSIDRLRESERTINGTTGTMTIAGRDQTGSVREEAVRRANAARANIRIGAADSTETTVQQIIGRINNKIAWIQVRAAGGGSGMTASLSEGAIMRYYANGGVENHVAQIAPAGTYRVWAETETGGEAYIPLALSKRSRSLAILDQVAREFGYALVGAGAQTFASGGTTRPLSSGPAGAGGITVQQLVVDVAKVRTLSELETWLRGLDIDLAMAGISH